jgi:glycosyltransferase involved in cell wall biosynthesis
MTRINKTASLCDGFTCTNEFLADRLRERYGRIVRVMPNLMNREQAEVSAQLVARGRPRRGRFLVGYFSGSPSHDNDFLGISEELLEFLRHRDDAELTVVGYLNLPPGFEALQTAGRVHCEPLKGYVELQESIWAADVSIVPLTVNDFTNCKSELKYFEAAAVGVPTIASRTHSYCQAIRHGDNGLLCEPGEWLKALETVYEGWRPDPSGLAAEARSRYL